MTTSAPESHSSTSSSPGLTTSPLHHHVSIDPRTYPSLTTRGPINDEYEARTAAGYISSTEEDNALTLVQVQGTGGVKEEVRAWQGALVAEEGKAEVKLVTFGVRDPLDPRNRSKLVRWLQTLILSWNCFVVALGSSITVMDFQNQADSLHTSLDVIHLTITLFVAGFACGPLIYSPLSEMIGRKPIYFIAGGGYFAFTLGASFSQNAATLVVCRALGGLFASANMAVIAGSIADLWAESERGHPLNMFSITVFSGPVIGPVIAGFLSSKGWRANYWLLAGLAFFGWALATVALPETFAVVILRRKAQKLREKTGGNWTTEQERFKRPLREIIKVSLLRPLVMLVTEPILLLFTIYLSLIYALLYLFFFAVPIVFGELHGFKTSSVGLAFLAILIGMILTVPTALPWQAKYYNGVVAECEEKEVPVPPEARLKCMMVGSILLPIGLFIFAFCSYSHVHWIGAAIGCGVFGFSFIAIYTGANSYIVDTFAEYAASAMASKTFMSRLAGAAMPMFVDRFYHSRLTPIWASFILAIIATLMAPIPFYFFFQGAKVRSMSKRAS